MRVLSALLAFVLLYTSDSDILFPIEEHIRYFDDLMWIMSFTPVTFIVTRMHSSRMRTAYFSGHLLEGGVQGGVSADGVSAWGCLPKGVFAQGVSA